MVLLEEDSRPQPLCATKLTTPLEVHSPLSLLVISYVIKYLAKSPDGV